MSGRFFGVDKDVAIQRLYDEIDRLTDENGDLKYAVDNNKDVADRLAAEVAALKERNGVQSSTITDYAKKLAEANGKVQELDAEVDSLLQKLCDSEQRERAATEMRNNYKILSEVAGGLKQGAESRLEVAEEHHRARYLAIISHLERLRPEGWHCADIVVRINGEDRRHQGDFLKDIYTMCKKAVDQGAVPVVNTREWERGFKAGVDSSAATPGEDKP